MRVFLGLICALCLVIPLPAQASAETIGLSQVKTRGSTAGDEFIELFNPHDTGIDIQGYRLIKQTSSGSSYTISTFGQITILPHSYLLLALEGSSFAASSDLIYKTALADNNTLILQDAGGSVVDQLAWGDGQSISNHTAELSYQRDWQSALATWSPWQAKNYTQAHRSGDLALPESMLVEEEEEIIPVDVVVPSTDALPAELKLSEVQLSVVEGDTPWVEAVATKAGSITAWTLSLDQTMFARLDGSVRVGDRLIVLSEMNTTPMQGTLSLINSNGITVDSVIIPSASKASQAYAVDKNGLWDWTDTTTAGRPNLIRLHPPAPACPVTSPAPALPDSEPPPTPAPTVPNSARLIINEVLANPSGDEASLEFVELHNLDGFEASTQGWIIADAAKQTILPDLRIPAQGFLVLRRSVTSLSLNNGTETVQLRSPSGQTVTAIAYDAAQEDLSWNSGDAWYEAVATPGVSNTPHTPPVPPAVPPVAIASEDEEDQDDAPPSESISPVLDDDVEPIQLSSTASTKAVASTNASTKTTTGTKTGQNTSFSSWPKVKPNTRVTLVGVLSVAPGTFGDKIATLQDVTGAFAGIELYFSAADWPDLEVGDIVEVTGKKSTAKLGDRLLLSSANDLVILDHVSFDPVLMTIDDLGPSQHRTLITLDTRILEQSRGILATSDDTGELNISLNKAKLDWGDHPLPARGLISGIYVHAPKPELWVRQEDDLVIEALPNSAMIDDHHDAQAQDAVPATPHTAPTPPTSTIIQPSTTASSPWIGPLAAAGSAGGLGWYFFQDQLRQHGSKLLERLRKSSTP